MNFNATNNTFRRLLGNGLTYKVPQFQRDYSWSTDEWDDLWEDIIALFEPENDESHYMGYLVLLSSGNRKFDILDGQQRLTTISILILACLAHLKHLAENGIDAEDNEKRKENLRHGYIGFVDPVSLTSKSKLELNCHNNRFYQRYLVPLETAPQRNLNSSEYLMRQASNWFQTKVKSYANEDGVKVAAFVDSLVDKLFFTVITVTDELNAFKVFETLNARGVRLSSTDLLKNYLFSIVAANKVHEDELQTLEETWEHIVGVLNSESFPEFLRAYWNSRNKLVRKTDLFKTIRKQITTREQAFTLIKNLEKASSIYASLQNPADAQWDSEEKDALQKLQMFNVRQTLPLLLKTFELWGENKRPLFKRVLNALLVFSFRYNVICNKQTHDQERLYNAISCKLNKPDKAAAAMIFSGLKELYPVDNEFKSAFADKEMRTTNMRNKKVVRYILFQIEKNIAGNEYNFDSIQYNIEHILPENPNPAEWADFREENISNYIFRIGNMTLMDAKPNRDIGNSPFSEKRVTYKESRFRQTAAIEEHYEEWKESIIDTRQKQFAQQAAQIWRINFG